MVGMEQLLTDPTDEASKTSEIPDFSPINVDLFTVYHDVHLPGVSFPLVTHYTALARDALSSTCLSICLF